MCKVSVAPELLIIVHREDVDVKCDSCKCYAFQAWYRICLEVPTHSIIIEDEVAANHGHPYIDPGGLGVVVQQLYMCLECHHRLS